MQSLFSDVSVVDAFYEVHDTEGQRAVSFAAVKAMNGVSRAWRLPLEKLVQFWLRLYKNRFYGDERDSMPLEMAILFGSHAFLEMLVTKFRVRPTFWTLRYALTAEDALLKFDCLCFMNPDDTWPLIRKNYGTVAKLLAQQDSIARLQTLLTDGTDELDEEQRHKQIRSNLNRMAPSALYGAFCGRKKDVAVWVRTMLLDGSVGAKRDYERALWEVTSVLARTAENLARTDVCSQDKMPGENAVRMWFRTQCGFPP